ncbi:MAG TPA: lysylphosphatidylglycerol synthase transmembrane domain-containing protein [Flavisolibacter sp.]|nr:lysylphosphatidylglycerol synthase transmembrane domain-containing protein [Flavisolibacter sp.]
MKKSFKSILQYCFFIGLGVLFVWLTVKDIQQQEWLQIQYSLRHARHWLLVPVIVMLLLSHYLRALRWKIMMEPLGYFPSNFNTMAAVMIGYLANTAVPRLGEVMKCSILSKYEGLKADKLIGTIVVERLIDVTCLLLVFMLALVFQGHIIGDYVANAFGNFFRDKSGGFASYKVLLVTFSLLTFIIILIFLFKRFAHLNVITKVNNTLKGLLQGLNSIRLIKRKTAFLVYTILIWLLYLLSTTAGIYALRETEFLGLAGGLTALGVGSIAMIITPGGIGAYPLLIAKLMELYGLDFKTIGTALGWLLWSAQTIIILVCGVIFSALITYFNKKEPAIENA